MALEASLDKIASDNDLTTVAVGRMPVAEDIVWTATVHWSGHSSDGNSCAGGNSRHSIQDAVHKALQQAVQKRTLIAVMPCKLPALEQAA